MSFIYHEPHSLEEATSLLLEHGDDAVALAGGSAVMLFVKLGLIRPGHVVGLGRLNELRGIRSDDRGLWIGAMSTHREVERSAVVRQHHDAIADTCSKVATVRIRNQGTVGGNLVHAHPAQDPPPTLIAFDAVVILAGPDGAYREASLDGFFADYFTVEMKPGEVVVGVRVPRPAGVRATFAKFLPRTADDYATVSVAAAVRTDEAGRITFARVVLGAVGPTPVRATAVEQALVGQRANAGNIADAAALVREQIDPITDGRGSRAYKVEMARVWTARALAEVTS